MRNKFGISLSSMTTNINGLPMITDVLIYDPTSLKVLEQQSFFFDHAPEIKESIYEPSALRNWQDKRESPIKAFSKLFNFLNKYDGEFQFLAHNPDFEINIMRNLTESLGYGWDYFEPRWSKMHINLMELGMVMNMSFIADSKHSSVPYGDEHSVSVTYKTMVKVHEVTHLGKSEAQLRIYEGILHFLANRDQKDSPCPSCLAKSFVDGKCWLCGHVESFIDLHRDWVNFLEIFARTKPVIAQYLSRCELSDGMILLARKGVYVASELSKLVTEFPQAIQRFDKYINGASGLRLRVEE